MKKRSSPCGLANRRRLAEQESELFQARVERVFGRHNGGLVAINRPAKGRKFRRIEWVVQLMNMEPGLARTSR